MQNPKFVFFNRAFSLFLLSAAFVLFLPQPHRAQTAAAPRREQLLNGLKLLVLSDSKSANVTVKLRVHAGAAFDPAGKEGTMRLLADILFPEEGTRPFFEEELGGKLEVESNYDFIEITASGRADEFERILDTVRVAALTPPITLDTFKRVRDARLQSLQTGDQTAAAIADRAARKRLFGDFPYARPADGTPESVAKIDQNDLLFARDRFLTADNATLFILGNVKDSYAIRAAKQLFGPWRKSEKPIPATFRQPDAPDSKILIVDAPGADRAEIRVALRAAPARADKDFAAAQILARVAEARLRGDLPDGARANFAVTADANSLPGAFIFRASAPTADAAATLAAIRNGIAKMSAESIKFAELSDYQKFFVPATLNAANSEDATEIWLDADTYKIASGRSTAQPTPADVNRLARQMFKNAQPAIVVVGNAEQIQPQLDGK